MCICWFGFVNIRAVKTEIHIELFSSANCWTWSCVFILLMLLSNVTFWCVLLTTLTTKQTMKVNIQPQLRSFYKVCRFGSEPPSVRQSTILTFWRRNYFFNFSTACIYNVNNTGTKQVRIMKQTAFWKKTGEYTTCLKYSVPIFVE